MPNLLAEMFREEGMRDRIREKLPYMFKLAELELSRGGHVGMEVGSLRERILIALLMYRFGISKVKEPPITLPQADVVLEGHDFPISIKTKSGTGYSGIKLIWTVDWQKVEEFYRAYQPASDMLLATIQWGKTGILAYIPCNIQLSTFGEMGREKYIRLPKRGTNPRGVEISSKALALNVEKAHREGLVIEIEWKVKQDMSSYNPYAKWVELWERD